MPEGIKLNNPFRLKTSAPELFVNMENGKPEVTDMNNLFRAPAARAIKTLDRSLFFKQLPSTAAVIKSKQNLAHYRKNLEKSKELLRLEKLKPVVPHPDPALAKQDVRCLVLDPRVDPAAPESWSSVLKDGVDAGYLELLPYTLDVDYSFWSYGDVLREILPEDLHGEIPSGFNSAGHVAHLNLRDQYLPYKTVIAQAIIDKNAHITTVINKVNDVGTDNEFRTFSYEVLEGPDDLLVDVRESGCNFTFDYGKVYWNSKLGHEHERVVGLFKPGEVVADVMGGIGPFAVPAGKKGVFVWANDKNPESYKYLEQNVQRNKVSQYVKPFNEDGHKFIHQAADLVLEASQRGDHVLIKPKVSRLSDKPPPPPTRIPVPPTISHYVMNLPASAIEFLHNFRGLYHGHEQLFTPHTDTLLPMIHVHCFAPKPNDDAAVQGVLDRIEKEIGVRPQPGNGEEEGQASFHEVRDVAPNKLMFCVSMRLPRKVAFAPRG